MASSHQVKQYLAHWFQLGKHVMLQNGHYSRLPQPVIEGSSYSQQFEACWQEIISPESGECYLEGTETTIADLLTPAWEVNECARCAMLVPVHTLGMPPSCCPCFDLPHWPNLEIPQPRLPVSSQVYLWDICPRLIRAAVDDCESA